VDTTPTGEAKEFVDATHPFGVAAREVVIDGDTWTPRPLSAFSTAGSVATRFLPSRFHLGDATLVQHHAAD